MVWYVSLFSWSVGFCCCKGTKKTCLVQIKHRPGGILISDIVDNQQLAWRPSRLVPTLTRARLLHTGLPFADTRRTQRLWLFFFVSFEKFVVVIKMNMPSFGVKHAVFRPEKPALSTLNMPCFKTRNPPNPASPLAPPPFLFRLRPLGVGGCHHFSFLRVAPARASTQQGRFRCVLEQFTNRSTLVACSEGLKNSW